jgi:hypothetical protein
VHRWFVILTLAGCVMTRAPRVEERPRWWIVRGATFEGDCLLAAAEIRRSGKQGIGVTLTLKSRRTCAARLVQGTLVVGREAHRAPPIALPALPGRSLRYAWLPIAFDNNAAWNAGARRGRLELELELDGRAHAWALELEQRP